LRTRFDYILLTLKGCAMGAADVVPGVSGGTIALITGIYQELLETIGKFNFSLLQILRKDGITSAWKHANGNFLVALLTGIAISILSLAKLFSWMLREHPVMVWSFFFGLVAASVWLVWKQCKTKNVGVFAAFLIGAAAAWGITSMEVVQGSDELWYVAISGAVAICAMILPGISGSFILLMMGMYEYVLNAVNDKDLKVLMVFAGGCMAGLLTFSRLLSWAFKKYTNLTLALMAGFLLGSLNGIWPWKEVVSTRVNSKGEEVPFIQKNILPDGGDNWLQGILLILAGAFLILLLDRIGSRRKA
jgi:putative membrane protein